MQSLTSGFVALIIWGSVLFPLAASLYGIFAWRGGWQVASAIPLVADCLFLIFLWWARSSAPPGESASQAFAFLLFIPLSMMMCAWSGVVVLLHRKRTSA